jgi:hypothetical protein
MAVATRSGIAATLEQAERELELLVRDSEHEVEGVAGDFGGLARETDGILSLAAAIVGCVETESILAVLDRVESMGGVARQFLEERLKATAGILETVVAEAKLLVRLSELTGAQRAIARETQTLSVLTNIEVARLGELGIGFQYLAHQLDDFSQSVAKGTRELSSHTEERRSAIEETRRMLVVELPHIRENLARTETRLGNALGVVNARLTELSRTPEQFRGCVAEIAGRIAGVVAAVQVQDITRQRVEHVGESLGLIRSLVSGLEDGETEEACGLPPIVAGLAIQSYQLRSVGETVGEWVSRIRSCIDGILRISCSEVVGIGPAVLLEVRELLEKLGGIEALEGESQAVNGEVESTLGGLSNLMQLVGEHLARSTEVRDRLRLITFNSIIEASHLGSEADAILEISQSIKRLAGVWSEITDRSGRGRAWRALAAQPTRPAGRHRRLRPRRAVSREGLRPSASEPSGWTAALRASRGLRSRSRSLNGNLKVKVRGSVADGMRQKWKSCLRQGTPPRLNARCCARLSGESLCRASN